MPKKDMGIDATLHYLKSLRKEGHFFQPEIRASLERAISLIKQWQKLNKKRTITIEEYNGVIDNVEGLPKNWNYRVLSTGDREP